jgi:hypothetical protein
MIGRELDAPAVIEEGLGGWREFRPRGSRGAEATYGVLP